MISVVLDFIGRVCRHQRQHAREHVHQVQFERAVEAHAAGADKAQDLELVGLPVGLHRLQNVGKVGADVLLHRLHQVHQEEQNAGDVLRVALARLHRPNKGRNDQRQVREGRHVCAADEHAS